MEEESYILTSKGFSLILTGAQVFCILGLSEDIMIALQLPGSVSNSSRLQQWPAVLYREFMSETHLS